MSGALTLYRPILSEYAAAQICTFLPVFPPFPHPHVATSFKNMTASNNKTKRKMTVRAVRD